MKIGIIGAGKMAGAMVKGKDQSLGMDKKYTQIVQSTIWCKITGPFWIHYGGGGGFT